MKTIEIKNRIQEAKSHVHLNILLSDVDIATRKNGFKSDLSRNLDLHPHYTFETLEDRKKYLNTIIDLFI